MPRLCESKRVLRRLVPASVASSLRLKAFAPHSKWILIVTGAGMSAGLATLAVWLVTGSLDWITWFFQWPWTVMMVGLSALQTWLGFSVRRAFLPDEPLHLAWSLIAFSATCDLLGAIAVQWLSSPAAVNPLIHASWWGPQMAAEIRQFGLIMGGTLRYTLLAAGLWYVLRIYRRAGFLGRLAAIDWFLLLLVSGNVINEAIEVAAAVGRGKSPSLPEVLGWPVDLLLCLLLAETRLLARSIQRMGAGSIGRCWRAFTIGILLIWLGDLELWVARSGHFPWQWASLGWYVWLPAAGAFAAAPAYQLEAVNQAMKGSGMGME